MIVGENIQPDECISLLWIFSSNENLHGIFKTELDKMMSNFTWKK